MPHISVKCYPKNLAPAELDAYVKELAAVTSKHLKADDSFISVDYAEIPAEEWKAKVYDPEIKARIDSLAKKPGYEM